MNFLPLNSPLLDSYDYIGERLFSCRVSANMQLTDTVVGGGPSGLTVANRLSEDATVNVLLLEAGPADNHQPWIQIPFFAGQGVGSSLDWNLLTAPQAYLDGRSRALPQGRVLGGGTNRGGIGDYDDWVTLGNPGWSFWDLMPYFCKRNRNVNAKQQSETFTPHPQSEIANAVGINQNPLVHGNKGPVNVSFSSHIYNETVNFFSALNELQMPVSYDPNDGATAGASFLPLALNPANQTRCDARSAYFEPYAMRPNLWVSTNQHVTRILFEGGSGNPNTTTPTPGDSSVGQGSSFSRPDGLFSNITQNGIASRRRMFRPVYRILDSLKQRLGMRKRQPTNTPVTSVGSLLRANGVEFASAASELRRNITAVREIIVAAGALHTPQVLKLSGLGPANELQSLQIPVLVDLPGVGMNLQDHALVGVFYPYQKPTSLTSVQIASNYSLMSQFGATYQANRTGPWTAGPPDGNAFPALSVLTNRSFSIITKAQTQKAIDYLPPDVHQNVIAGFEAQRQLLIKALQDPKRAAYELLNFNYGAFSNVNMRPFSRSTVKVLGTTSMKLLEPLQLNPRPNATDQEILQFIKANIQTEFHPSGTCAMLPLDLGGVVDPQLLVYGTQNLRIVDASIMPVIPASHLQAVVYGVSEKVGTRNIISIAIIFNFTTATTTTSPTANVDVVTSQAINNFSDASAPICSHPVTREPNIVFGLFKCILQPCVVVHMHMYVCMHLCADVYLRGDTGTSFISVHHHCYTTIGAATSAALTQRWFGRHDLPTSVDVVLPTSTSNNGFRASSAIFCDSLTKSDLHIRTDFIFITEHKLHNLLLLVNAKHEFSAFLVFFFNVVFRSCFVIDLCPFRVFVIQAFFNLVVEALISVIQLYRQIHVEHRKSIDLDLDLYKSVDDSVIPLFFFSSSHDAFAQHVVGDDVSTRRLPMDHKHDDTDMTQLSHCADFLTPIRLMRLG
ncbi:hypothetical protein D6C84_06535 [Aureobasidium pullulans]|uniref:Glucose-methanol-choline oxidoreductase N-terminal domain-containing protein n=1 Tax=Aureobasidium pullulans TaxID=5580 RepID=A0A4S9XPT5_AURPU|nr:hypothetical protein D6C84_06535 [Aureobasidium pullulans]